MNDRRTPAEQFSDIAMYMWPELVTAFVLHVLPRLIESIFISNLKSTTLFAALGVTMTLIHFIVKVAEGLSVGTLVLVAKDNGAGRYEEAGKTFTTAVWMAIAAGVVVSASIFLGTTVIYSFYGFSDHMKDLAVPYLKLRALGIFFTFVYFTFIGFLRGVKNTQVPGAIFAMGAAFFILTAYPLIFGIWGFEGMRQQGVALAGVLQFGLMSLLALGYIIWSKQMEKYNIRFFSGINFSGMKKIVALSLPITVDKAAMAIVPMWLGKCFSPLGKVGLASFNVVKDMERVVLLPANALAQVATILMGNHYGMNNWPAIKKVISRVMALLTVTSVAVVILMVWYRKPSISLFDSKNAFTDFSVQAFLFLGPLMLFDSVQLVLSGFLRGAMRVNVVMITRLVVIFCFFIPLTSLLSYFPLQDPLLQFLSVYVIFYMSTGLMGLVYWYYIKRRLKQQEKELYGTHNETGA